VTVEIGGVPVRFSTGDAGFLDSMRGHYKCFVPESSTEPFELTVKVISGAVGSGEEVTVTRHGQRIRYSRRGFDAECCLASRRGSVSIAEAHPYFTDIVLRVLHSLLLAPRGGFLLHAASHVRNGRAFIFAGVSGAGKTTISRLAPPDTRILSDEVTFVRPLDGRYFAFGTPYVSSLGKPGENICAPVEALYLLAKGPENRCERLSDADAARALLRNIVFFATDADLVGAVFQSGCDFLLQTPVFRLTFVPNASVWELIQ
jgi:hypothetical protein